MKKLLFSLLVAFLCFGQVKAAEPENLFVETFANVNGTTDGTTAIDPTQLDNPEGWTFNDAYAGPGFIIIKKGGSVTLPAIPNLSGNASFYFNIMGYNTEIGDDIYEFENHTLSLNIGELSTTWVDGGSSGMDDTYCIFDVTPESRMTISAKEDIKFSYARIYYGSNGGWGVVQDDKMFQYSVSPGDEYDPKEFYRPIDLTVKSGINVPHTIIVYTIDGTTPTRASTRYEEGSPFHIDKTTTLTFGLISRNGYMYIDKPKTYTFPVATEPEIPASTVKITVNTGSLESQLEELDVNFVEGLELHGAINGKDLSVICNPTGMMSRLSYLNMKDVTFVFDDYCYKNASYAPEGGMGQSGGIFCYFSAENKLEIRSPGPSTTNYYYYSNNLARAFYAHPTLTRIELPDQMISIGENAFYNCPNLKMVTMSPNMTEIEKSAFYYTKVETINIPESLETINDYAFSGTKITGDLNLPNLKYIGESAFGGTKILSFVFNPGIEYIGKGAFSGTLLESVNMPNPPEVIRTNTFACDELKEAKFGEGLKRLEANIFGYNTPEIIELPQSLIELAAYALPDKYIQSITPEDGIRYVGGVAYQVAEERDEYTIKAGTKSLAEELFQWNSSVKKVTVPNSVTIVGKRAFAGSGIESIPAMEGVTEWPEELFENCKNLARITIPENITKIDNNVFNYCSSLWQVKYNAIDADLLGFWGYRPSSVKLILGDKVERIPAGLFDNNVTNTDLVLPKSVERIDTSAFVSNRNLRSIYLPDGIKVIEPETFRWCDNLEEVHMPLNLERISKGAFMQCESLKTISIPEGTKILEDYAFHSCNNASTLYIPSTLISIGIAPFYQLGSNTEVKITAASVDPLIADGASKDILSGVETRDVVQIKVPNASVEDYKNHPQWGRFAAVIVPIDEIAAKEESVSTSFETAAIDETTDLSDAVVGDIYVTVSEDSGDGYDATDGSIVLSSTMTDDDAEAIGGLAPGKSDLANRFNGLVTMVHAGKGSVTINCLTIGTKHVGVKIGDGEPRSFKQDSKGDITVDYSVMDDTYVYVYAIETAPVQEDPAESPRRIKSRAANDCIKIYAITVVPTSLSGIEDLEAESNLSPVTDWYTLDGVKVDNPSAKGIYIAKHEDGTVTKIIIK